MEEPSEKREEERLMRHIRMGPRPIGKPIGKSPVNSPRRTEPGTPVKTEPPKPAPAQATPVKAEPPKPAPAQATPVKAEPPKPAPAQATPVSAEPAAQARPAARAVATPHAAAPRPKTATSKARRASVDLDDLMSSLDAIASKPHGSRSPSPSPAGHAKEEEKKPEPAPAVAAPPPAAPAAEPAKEEKKAELDLDSLMSGLDDIAAEAKKTETAPPAPAPKPEPTPAPAPAPVAEPTPKPDPAKADMSESLDSLISSLDDICVDDKSAAKPAPEPVQVSVAPSGVTIERNANGNMQQTFKRTPLASANAGSPATFKKDDDDAKRAKEEEERKERERKEKEEKERKSTAENLDNIISDLDSLIPKDTKPAAAPAPAPAAQQTRPAPRTDGARLCTGCGQPIVGAFMRFEDKMYHEKCLVCSRCKTPLQTFRKFADGGFACEECYRRENPQRVCATCGKPIVGNAVMVMGVVRHAECFRCDYCHKLIPEEFIQHDGKVYCPPNVSECYKLALGRVCDGCGKTLDQSFLTVLGKRYHKDCFRCAGCHMPFPTLQFYSINDKPYCEACSRLQQ